MALKIERKWMWAKRDTRWDVYPQREPFFLTKVEIERRDGKRTPHDFHTFFFPSGQRDRIGGIPWREAHPYAVDCVAFGGYPYLQTPELA